MNDKIRYLLAHDDEIQDNQAPAKGMVWGVVYGFAIWIVCLLLFLLHLQGSNW